MVKVQRQHQPKKMESNVIEYASLKECFHVVDANVTTPIEYAKDRMQHANNVLEAELPILEKEVEKHQFQLGVIAQAITDLERIPSSRACVGDLRKVYAQMQVPYQAMVRKVEDTKMQIKNNKERIAECDLRLDAIKDVLSYFKCIREEDEDE